MFWKNGKLNTETEEYVKPNPATLDRLREHILSGGVCQAQFLQKIREPGDTYKLSRYLDMLEDEDVVICVAEWPAKNGRVNRTRRANMRHPDFKNKFLGPERKINAKLNDVRIDDQPAPQAVDTEVLPSNVELQSNFSIQDFDRKKRSKDKFPFAKMDVGQYFKYTQKQYVAFNPGAGQVRTKDIKVRFKYWMRKQISRARISVPNAEFSYRYCNDTQAIYVWRVT